MFVELLIALAAYSSGFVGIRRIALKSNSTEATPIEALSVALGVAVFAINAPSRVSALHVVTVMACALALGAVFSVIFRQSAGRAGTREFEAQRSDCESGLWNRWVAFNSAVADHEVRIVVVLCYLVLVAPLAAAFRFTPANPQNAKTSWVSRSPAVASIELARKPF